jgi:hypothetical protein
VPYLGIDFDGHLYYYAESVTSGYALWPHPTITPARLPFGQPQPAVTVGTGPLADATIVFREDSFDPVSRVRRGRLYAAVPERHMQWQVRPHPAFPDENDVQRALAGLRKPLLTYAPLLLPLGLRTRTQSVELGGHDAATRWRLVDVERIATGEDLVTLKAASRMGTLPELSIRRMRATDRKLLEDVYDKAADAAYRLDPESTVDRCREAATACAGLWLAKETGDVRTRTLDLGHASDALQKHRKEVASYAGRLIARLHSRGKTAERVRRNVEPPSDDDAALALHCLGLIARELGFARG